MMLTAWWDISSEAFDWFLKLRSLKWNTKRVFEKRWLHFVSATIVFLARRALHSDSLTAGRDVNICCHFFCLDNVSRAFPSLMVATTDSHRKPFVIRTLEMTQIFFGFIECVHLRDSPQVRIWEMEEILSAIGWNVDVSKPEQPDVLQPTVPT